MAYEEALRCISVPASGDLSSYQYRFVKIDSDGEAALCGAGELARGVLQNAPAAAGRAASIAIEGESKVVAVSGVSAGDLVASDSLGRATTRASGDNVLGVAHHDCTATGQIITVGLISAYYTT